MGTPRTVYLSMTDKMTANKFNTKMIVSIDGTATGFVSAIASAPELLHPNTKYYAHFYEGIGTTGKAIEKLEFTTEDFPANYPTTQGTYSSFYNQITSSSSSPAMEYKASERYLIPARLYYYLTGGSYSLVTDFTLNRLRESAQNARPFRDMALPLLIYDLYNIDTSGPVTNVSLWDTMIGISQGNLNEAWQMDHLFGGQSFLFYDNKKTVLVTE